MKQKFIKPEIAYKYILEVDESLNKIFNPILNINTSLKSDGVYAKISADQRPSTKLLFKDDCIVLLNHGDCYKIDISQETYQAFMARECGPFYVGYLAGLEQTRHEEELNRILALNNECGLNQ